MTHEIRPPVIPRTKARIIEEISYRQDWLAWLHVIAFGRRVWLRYGETKEIARQKNFEHFWRWLGAA